mmetsp:Transcript_86440/g.152987  ORF Transcript_86440/g.152987 Transcript_86440/m.152987 type:complete len:215 (+) Transcript_86440:3121-3765(+)
MGMTPSGSDDRSHKSHCTVTKQTPAKSSLWPQSRASCPRAASHSPRKSHWSKSPSAQGCHVRMRSSMCPTGPAARNRHLCYSNPRALGALLLDLHSLHPLRMGRRPPVSGHLLHSPSCRCSKRTLSTRTARSRSRPPKLMVAHRRSRHRNRMHMTPSAGANRSHSHCYSCPSHLRANCTQMSRSRTAPLLDSRGSLPSSAMHSWRYGVGCPVRS